MKYNDTLKEDMLFEMSNIRQASSGLPMIIFVSRKGHAKHGPRIKVQLDHSHKYNSDNCVSVTVEAIPQIIAGNGLANRDLQQVIRFIQANRDALTDLWFERIDAIEFARRMQKI